MHGIGVHATVCELLSRGSVASHLLVAVAVPMVVVAAPVVASITAVPSLGSENWLTQKLYWNDASAAADVPVIESQCTVASVASVVGVPPAGEMVLPVTPTRWMSLVNACVRFTSVIVWPLATSSDTW